MNPSRVDEEAKEASGNVPGVVAAAVGVGLLGVGLGYATSQKVPEGKVGVVPKSDWYETNPTRFYLRECTFSQISGFLISV